MLELPRIYPILDAESLARATVPLAAAAGAFLEGGAQILQIRQKGQWTREFFDAAREVARLCIGTHATLIVNDRAHFAMLLASGLHVGQEDLSPRDARHLLGPKPVIGFSSHTAEQIAAAAAEPVDYVAYGPVFATSTKASPDPVVGTEGIRAVRGLTNRPLVAIGGITLENAASVWSAGADSVAVIGGLIPTAPDLRALRTRMEEWQTAARHG